MRHASVMEGPGLDRSSNAALPHREDQPVAKDADELLPEVGECLEG
jgi:hypothetical protein